MNCENIYCVYWAQDGCVLSEITLDIQGKCENCLYIPIDEAELAQKRQAFLQKQVD